MFLFRPNVSKMIDKKDIAGLLKALSYRKDSIVQLEAVSALGSLYRQIDDIALRTKVMESLISILRDNEEWGVIRATAAKALGNTGDTRADRPLWEMTRSQDVNISKAALEALEKLGHFKFVSQREPHVSESDHIGRDNIGNEIYRADETAQMMPESNDGMQSSRSYPDRLVRVFISSTFRDMQEEREILIKRVFPEIRQRCRERSVEFVEVDLRWGVTEEQAMGGEVLPICLAEIDHCREYPPYFIGLLGERYGSAPEHIQKELVDSHPWLDQYRDRSNTELEMLYGVIMNKRVPDCSYFYFRDPAYIDRISPERRRGYLSNNDVERARLADLKQRIRESGSSLVENYPYPAALGQMVLNDLWNDIDKRFPAASVPGPLEREEASHRAFAMNLSKVYIGRKEYFDRIDDYINSVDPPLVLLGESGSGKSALLANWANHYQKSHPEEFMIQHFIGGTQRSTDYTAIMRRIMGELKRRFNIPMEVPDNTVQLRSEFPGWLAVAADQSLVILVLDGLDQLEDRDNAPDLYWLPVSYQKNVRLIVSTLPGRSLNAIHKRDWTTYTVEKLNPNERKRLVREYLSYYRKNLSDANIDRIIQEEQTSIPLYLRTLLEELRIFGIYEQLNQYMDSYLAERTIEGLFSKILTRYEKDYEKVRPGLVGDAMKLIWASRYGISESELLAILGKDDQELIRALWSPLYLAAIELLVSRSGFLTFFHQYFRRAVQEKYLKTFEQQLAAHKTLADYFDKQNTSLRKIDEFPWQLARAHEWERLKNILVDEQFLNMAWKNDHEEVLALWQQVEANSQYKIADAYLPMLNKGNNNPDYTWHIAALLDATGHKDMALPLQKQLIDYYRANPGNLGNLSALLDNQAMILYSQGHLQKAVDLLMESEQIHRSLGDINGLANCLNNQGVILIDTGHLDQAMNKFKTMEQVCRQLGNKTGLANCMGNKARVLYMRGNPVEALQMYKEAADICHDSGDRRGLAGLLINQAYLNVNVFRDLKTAMSDLNEAEKIFNELGDRAGIGNTRLNIGNIQYLSGELDDAITSLKRAESIFTKLGNKKELAESLGHQALVFAAMNDTNTAISLCKKELALYRELDFKEGMADSLGKRAILLASAGDFDGAAVFSGQCVKLNRDIEDIPGLALALSSHAMIVSGKSGIPGDALPFTEEAYHLAGKNGLEALARQIKSQLDLIKSRL